MHNYISRLFPFNSNSSSFSAVSFVIFTKLDDVDLLQSLSEGPMLRLQDVKETIMAKCVAENDGGRSETAFTIHVVGRLSVITVHYDIQLLLHMTSGCTLTLFTTTNLFPKCLSLMKNEQHRKFR